MSHSRLPERASLEYLRKLAKERLRELRVTDPAAKLSAAQLAVAREHGFASWRGLKAEVDRRRASPVGAVFAACSSSDAAALRALLDADPALARARHRSGATPLHAAVTSVECVRLLLERGADPDARDADDEVTPLHVAAANGCLASVRALLDAGADVHGHGDVHGGDVIGWAVGDGKNLENGVVALLLERGAKHHVFSAIATGDPELVRRVVAEDPQALSRRRSRFEQGQTPLHFALAAPNATSAKTPQYRIAEVLIELGADLEAEDDLGRTPLAVAMLQGDLEAMRLLEAAGAKAPEPVDATDDARRLAALGESMVRQVTPMLCVSDPDATVALYTSLGFTLDARVPETGPIGWAALSFGKVQLMVQHRVARPTNQIALWFHTTRIEELYELFRSRRLAAARAALAGDAGEPEFQFAEDLYSPHYGGRQFSIHDRDGFELVFQSE
jgi:ankyrin repeat protein